VAIGLAKGTYVNFEPLQRLQRLHTTDEPPTAQTTTKSPSMLPINNAVEWTGRNPLRLSSMMIPCPTWSSRARPATSGVNMSAMIMVAMTAWLASKYDVKQMSPVGLGPESKSVKFTPVKLQNEPCICRCPIAAWTCAGHF